MADLANKKFVYLDSMGVSLLPPPTPPPHLPSHPPTYRKYSLPQVLTTASSISFAKRLCMPFNLGKYYISSTLCVCVCGVSIAPFLHATQSSPHCRKASWLAVLPCRSSTTR